jgi:hypothetical protein
MPADCGAGVHDATPQENRDKCHVKVFGTEEP